MATVGSSAIPVVWIFVVRFVQFVELHDVQHIELHQSLVCANGCDGVLCNGVSEVGHFE